MGKTTIDLSETGHFSSLLVNYLNEAPELSSFYSHPPTLEGFRHAIGEKGYAEADRTILVNTINEQYYGLEVSDAVKRNIALLKDPSTFTVTTGHQLCMFTGPLYFIYKIATTINLASALNREFPGNNFVPVYWMASEDHDFIEVNHAHVFGKTLTWEKDAKGAVGKLDTLGVTVIIQQLEHMLVNEPHGKELLAILREAYTGSNTLADATRALVNRLFGAYGLVVIEPDSKALKQQFVKVMMEDMLTGINNKLVSGSISKLETQGLPAQVSPREINLFYMHEGSRERIEREGNGFKVLNTGIVFTEEQIIREIQEHPERFSPNVVLRPLFQQMVLPNIAYVGGPAEIAYWFEYKAMFDHHGVRFPVLMPRNFVMLFDKPLNERLEKLSMNRIELFAKTDDLVRSFVSRNSGEVLDIASEEEQVKNVYRSLLAKAEKLDPTLKFVVEAELQKQLNAMKNIQAKLVRAEKQRQETSVNQVRKIKDKLFPEGMLQERYDNFIPYYARHGKKMIEMLMPSLDPFEYKLLMLDLE